MASVKDDRGYNQGFRETNSTIIRLQRRCNAITSEMDFTQTKEVLEIGCGTGRLSYMIAQKPTLNVLGTDICIPFIEEATENYKMPNLKYQFLDFNNPQILEGKQFDYIIGNGILHHLYYNLDTTFINLKKLLKPNGKLIFFEPNLYNLYIYLIFSIPKLRQLANLEPDEMAFSKSFISKKLNATGYKTVKVTFKDFLLPGIPDILIQPSIVIGNIAEKIPLIKMTSQSIFIVAEL